MQDQGPKRLAPYIKWEQGADSSASGAGQTVPSPDKPLPQFDQSPLPAAMLAVASQDSPENRHALYESMFKTWFLVPVKETSVPETPGFHDVHKDLAGSFQLENDSAGQVVAVAFTDEEALRNWNKIIPWIALEGAAFFKAVASTEAEEIVINPFEPEDPGSKLIRPAGRVTRWEFEALAQERNPQDQKNSMAEAHASPGVLVTMPKQMPSAKIFSALGSAAHAFSQITSMHFAQLIYPDGQPHHAIAIEFAPDIPDQQTELPMVAMKKAALHLFPREEKIEVFSGSTALGRLIAQSGEKFYDSKK